MANNGQDNLIPLNQRTKEEQRAIATMGGIASGKARQEKATMKKTLEMLLGEKNKLGKTYRELATLGLIKGAIEGKADNYKTMVALLGELEDKENNTPSIEIKIVDNSNLERVMYEDSDDQ